MVMTPTTTKTRTLSLSLWLPWSLVHCQSHSLLYQQQWLSLETALFPVPLLLFLLLFLLLLLLWLMEGQQCSHHCDNVSVTADLEKVPKEPVAAGQMCLG